MVESWLIDLAEHDNDCTDVTQVERAHAGGGAGVASFSQGFFRADA